MTPMDILGLALAANAPVLTLLAVIVYRQGSHYSWLKSLGKRLDSLCQRITRMEDRQHGQTNP